MTGAARRVDTAPVGMGIGTGTVSAPRPLGVTTMMTGEEAIVRPRAVDLPWMTILRRAAATKIPTAPLATTLRTPT